MGPFSQLTKTHEIKLKSQLPVQQHYGFPAALLCVTNRILLATSNTRLAVDFYKWLGDVEILGPTICPGPFLTHVHMASMPLINSIKDLLPWYNNLPSKMLPILAQLTSPQNIARFFTGHLNPFETVFGSYFGSIAMLPMKLLQPIPLSARIHVSKLDAHLPMHQDIHDVVVGQTGGGGRMFHRSWEINGINLSSHQGSRGEKNNEGSSHHRHWRKPHPQPREMRWARSPDSSGRWGKIFTQSVLGSNL